jgi:hypothetical protein
MYEYKLGFKAIADLIPDIVGEPLEDEHHDSPNGDGLQATRMPSGATGLFVWRKADNWTAFTNGHMTWVMGPNGLERRLNSERFPWERDPIIYTPSVLWMPANPMSITKPFITTPRGFALHGTRSGKTRPMTMEFSAACDWAVNRRDGLAANATIGHDIIAIHIPWTRWGWHAYAASSHYISFEFAQGTVADDISDGQIRTAAWAIRQSQEVHPNIPLHFPTHAELEHSGETGLVDGKTDIYPINSPRTEDVRRRLLEELGRQ